MQYPINEMFQTLQGEGYFTGVPAIFIRLQGCPVGCAWCDTKHTWEKLEDREVSLFSILAKTKESDKPRFCLPKKSAASGNVSLPPHPCTGYTSFSTTSRISVKRPFSSKQYHAVPSWSCPSVSAQAQEYWRDRPSSDQARGTHRG